MHIRIQVLLALLLAGLAGCTTGVGPRTIPPERMNYNQHIVQSFNEQLLLNIVRLRYSDTPMFLELNNVVTQYTIEGSASARATIGLDGTSANESGLGFGAGYAERPTMTYAPLQGEDFARRILSPIAPETILLLSQSGWSIERLLLMCAKSINGVPNALSASGPTPADPPKFEEFHRAAALFRELQKSSAMGLKVSIDSRPSEPTFLSLPETKSNTPLSSIRNDLGDLLGLPSDQSSFKITSVHGRQAPDTIGLHGRSLMAVFFLLSQSVKPPPSHIHKELLTMTRAPDGTVFDWTTVTGKLLRIRSSNGRPGAAYIAVPYRDAWFYIEDTDLNSKATMGLLNLLFSLQSVTSSSTSPLLTLPAGG